MGGMQSIVEMFVFHPPRATSVDTTAEHGAEKRTVRASHSVIPLFILHAESTGAGAGADNILDTDDNRTWLILSHGTTEDCSTSLSFARYLADALGVNVLLYEYPGYGESGPVPGSTFKEIPSQEGVFAAARAAYDFLFVDMKVGADKIVAMGWSVGSGPTMELATSRNVAGVILQSAFLSVIRMKVSTPWSFSCDVFPNRDKASCLNQDVRTLVLHGMSDTVVDVQHGHELQAILKKRGNAHGEGVWLHGRGHTDVPRDSMYIGAIQEFLRSVRQHTSGFVMMRGAGAGVNAMTGAKDD